MRASTRRARGRGLRVAAPGRRPERDIPPLLIAHACGWLLVLMVRMGGRFNLGASVLVAAAAVSALITLVAAVIDVLRGRTVLHGARTGAVIVLLAAVPLAVDRRAFDVFGLPKFALVVAGTSVVTLLWGVDSAWRGRALLPRSPVVPVAVAFALWTGASAMQSVVGPTSLTGDYKSWDGLYLTVSLVALFCTSAQTFELRDLVPAARSLVFVAGGLVSLYALVQIHDRLGLPGGEWDWASWDRYLQESGIIISTFGNPNFLAGALSAVIPAGVALAVVARGGIERFAALAVAATSTLVVLYARSLGGWFATLCALVVVGLLLAPDIRARPRPAAIAAVAGTGAISLALIALAVSGTLGAQFRGLFTRTNTLVERVDWWRTSIRMAADRPLLGWGPDMFRFVFPRYQSAEQAAGPLARREVNGPHNFLFNRLVDLGVPGALLFLGVLLLTALAIVGCWRRLRRRELEGDPDARRARVLVAGFAGSLAGLVAQAMFNVESVGLSFTLWAVMGLLAGAGAGAGVPFTYRPAALLSAGAGAPPVPPPSGRTRRRPAQSRSAPDTGRLARAGVVAALGAVVAATLAWTASTGLRADRLYLEGKAAEASMKKSTNDQTSRRLAGVSKQRFEAAAALDPTQPIYMTAAGEVSLLLAQDARADVRAERALLLDATHHYGRAARLWHTDFKVLNAYADSLRRLARREPDVATKEAVLRRAVEVMRRSLVANPWIPDTSRSLAAVLNELGRHGQAIEVIETALARMPRDISLRHALARLHEAAGNGEAAARAWHGVLELDPDSPEAKKALGPA